MSASFMACSAVTVALFPEFLIKLFTNDFELIKVCIPVVHILCIFQVFDGMQAALAGIFKGLKQTNVVMISNFIAFWIISLPLGCFLGLKLGLNLLGFWYSLGTAIIVLCAIMFVTMLVKFKKLEDVCRTSS